MTAAAPSFRSKVLKSAKLAGFRFVSEIGVRLVSTIVLTRLLAPEIYGVFAIVLTFQYLLEMFSDLDVRTLVLTKEGEVEDDFLRSCWVVSILRGAVLALLTLVIAGVIAGLQAAGVFASDSPYDAADLPWVIAALGSATLILGLQSPVRLLREREMMFGRLTATQITANVLGLVVTIALAVWLRSIWALVIGAIVKNAILVGLSFALFPGPRMRLILRGADLRLFIDRGKWIVSHSALTAVADTADRLLLGLVMSSTTFGYYYIARQLVDIVYRFLLSVSMQMSVQVFTHIQKSTAADFRRNYYRYRLFFDALAGLSAGGIIVLAPLLVEIVFDDRYRGVAPILQVIVLGVLLVGPLLMRAAYYAERRFRVMTWLSVVSTVTIWIGLLAAVFVFGSVLAGLVVIALFRLPEVLIFAVMGYRRGWVVIWREAIGLGFCLVGASLGWGILTVWSNLV